MQQIGCDLFSTLACSCHCACDCNCTIQCAWPTAYSTNSSSVASDNSFNMFDRGSAEGRE